jgi:hypothetical protein
MSPPSRYGLVRLPGIAGALNQIKKVTVQSQRADQARNRVSRIEFKLSAHLPIHLIAAYSGFQPEIKHFCIPEIVFHEGPDQNQLRMQFDSKGLIHAQILVGSSANEA